MGTPSVSLSLPFLPQKEEVDAFQTTSLGTMHVHRQLKAQTNAKLHSLSHQFFAVLAPLPEVDPFGLAARPKPDRSQTKTPYFQSPETPIEPPAEPHPLAMRWLKFTLEKRTDLASVVLEPFRQAFAKGPPLSEYFGHEENALGLGVARIGAATIEGTFGAITNFLKAGVNNGQRFCILHPTLEQHCDAIASRVITTAQAGLGIVKAVGEITRATALIDRGIQGYWEKIDRAAANSSLPPALIIQAGKDIGVLGTVIAPLAVGKAIPPLYRSLMSASQIAKKKPPIPTLPNAPTSDTSVLMSVRDQAKKKSAIAWNQYQASLEIEQNLVNYNIGVELIVAGINPGDGCHLYSITHPGVSACHDTIGYACVGSGAPHALYSLIASEYTKDKLVGQVEAYVDDAKKKSEVAPGVGTETEKIILPPATIEAVPEVMHTAVPVLDNPQPPV